MSRVEGMTTGLAAILAAIAAMPCIEDDEADAIMRAVLVRMPSNTPTPTEADTGFIPHTFREPEWLRLMV